MSGRSSGLLTEWDAGAGGYSPIESRHGFGVGRLVMRSRAAGYDWVVGTVREEGIECGLEGVGVELMMPAGEVDQEHKEAIKQVCVRVCLSLVW